MMTGPFAHIKGVFLDLDGTLKISMPSGVDAVLGYIADYGLPVTHEARRRGHRFAHEYWANRDQVEDDMERLGSDRFWANYIRAKISAMDILPPGQSPAEETVQHINRRFATEFNPRSRLEVDAPELLTRLRNNGFIVGLVSNRPLPLKETAERLDIYQHFHFTLAAGEIGSWKPDPGIFLHALEMAGDLRPQEALYIGDNYFADAQGAHNAGLNAILVDPWQAFPEAEAIAFVVNKLGDLLPYLTSVHR